MNAFDAAIRCGALISTVITIACSDNNSQSPHVFDIIDVSVSGNLPEPIAFAWQGDVTTLQVRVCDEPCPQLKCENGLLSYDGARAIWSIGVFSDTHNKIGSPVTYGMLGSAPDPDAGPLEPDLLHGIDVKRYSACTPEEDCEVILRAVGCALFTP